MLTNFGIATLAAVLRGDWVRGYISLVAGDLGG
jgi:hypothetical protein